MTEKVYNFDILVVGAGLAGCSAAVEGRLAGLSTAVLSKLHPLRSHSGAAQGGINAAINEENTLKHELDTLKGSDYLADPDGVSKLCAEAPETIRRLDSWGAVFSRNENGTIAQRPFGGQYPHRTCYAKDRTGLTCLQTLYEQAVKQDVRFFDEFYMLDLLYDREENRVTGIVAYDFKDSCPVVFSARAVVLATGGYARVFERNSNAHANTGDALSVILRNGLPLEDMEFVQFHPTGLANSGILISEAARGEGARLLNARGERFMIKYAPESMELSPRDVVSRAVEKEILEGRGCGKNKNAVYLDLAGLGPENILRKLPELYDLALTFQKEDMTRQPISIAPTAHYSMGGIPTDIMGRVLGTPGVPVTGLYAAGECACVSVHGANRLGGNSLLEALVYGRSAGTAAVRDMSRLKRYSPNKERFYSAAGELKGFFENDGRDDQYAVRKRMAAAMSKYAGVFREGGGLEELKAIIRNLKKRYSRVRITDRSSCFNTELQDALELGHMLDYAWVITQCAEQRKESRGAHFRTDYPARDDGSWKKHSYARLVRDGNNEAHVEITYGPLRGVVETGTAAPGVVKLRAQAVPVEDRN